MLVAIAVAISRILLGAHHPSDIVTATVIALAIAWWVFQFFERAAAQNPLQISLSSRANEH